MPHKFIPCMTQVHFDASGNATVIEHKSETTEEQILNDTYKAIRDDNYDDFVKLYHKYYLDESVADFFYVWETTNGEYYVPYPLCDCWKKYKSYSVHKRLDEYECRCKFGKKFLILYTSGAKGKIREYIKNFDDVPIVKGHIFYRYPRHPENEECDYGTVSEDE